MKGSRRSSDKNRGFTLTEVLIVSTLVGLVMSVLALTFSAIVRTTPITQGHIDDARSLRAISTWLSQDAISTEPVDLLPPGPNPHANPWVAPASPLGFDTHPSNPGLCPGANPGTNMAQLAWNQVASSTTVYVANYRFDPNGGDPKIVRIACQGANFGSLALTSTIAFTDGLSTSQDFVTGSPNVAKFTQGTKTLTFSLVSESGAIARVSVASRNP